MVCRATKKKKSETYFIEVTDAKPLDFLTSAIKEVVAARGLVEIIKAVYLFIEIINGLPKGET